MMLTKEQAIKIQKYLDRNPVNAQGIEFMLKILKVPHKIDYDTNKITFFNTGW